MFPAGLLFFIENTYFRKLRMTQVPGSYSKQDLLYLKGIAIFMIVLHNYFHWIPGYGVENEFNIELAHTHTYLSRQFDGFFAFIKWNFSFWGHLGVVLFVFCSGYGLTKRNLAKPEPYFTYLYKRLSKLYLLLLTGMLVVVSLRLLNFRYLTPFPEFVLQFLKRASGIANLKDAWYLSFSGPFWYFALAVQLYLIFPLLYRFVLNRKPVYSILLGMLVVLANTCLYPVARAAGMPLFANFPGHLPEFLLGILLASGKLKYRFGLLSLLPALALLIAAQFSVYLFPFSAIAATVAALSLFELLKGHIKIKSLAVLLRFTGTISMSLFIVNGVFRELKWFRDSDNNLVDQRIFIYLPLLFIFSFIVNTALNFVWKKIASKQVLKA